MTQPTEKRTWRNISPVWWLILLGLAVLIVRGPGFLGEIKDGASAQNDRGVMYDKGRGVPQNYEKAFELFTKSAEQGHAIAQYNLGVMYLHGKGVPQNDQSAAHWFKKSAKQGKRDGQYSLGLMYGTGRGVSLNYKKAYMWLNLAVYKRHSEAQKDRDTVAKKLSSQDLIEAQKMTKRCLDSGYKNC